MIIAEKLAKKVLKIAAQICWMHGSVAGHRTCQDWSGETNLLDDLTPEEQDWLFYLYEEHNSKGRDFKQGYFPYDEMLISFIIARALDIIDIQGKL